MLHLGILADGIDKACEAGDFVVVGSCAGIVVVGDGDVAEMWKDLWRVEQLAVESMRRYLYYWL